MAKLEEHELIEFELIQLFGREEDEPLFFVHSLKEPGRPGRIVTKGEFKRIMSKSPNGDSVLSQLDLLN